MITTRAATARFFRSSGRPRESPTAQVVANIIKMLRRRGYARSETFRDDPGDSRNGGLPVSNIDSFFRSRPTAPPAGFAARLKAALRSEEAEVEAIFTASGGASPGANEPLPGLLGLICTSPKTIGVSLCRVLNEMGALYPDLGRVLFITNSNLTSHTKTLVQRRDVWHWEIFQRSEFENDLYVHPLVFPHRLATVEEKEQLLKRLDSVDLEKIDRLLVSDKLCRYHAFPVGSLVKITSVCHGNGLRENYRMVTRDGDC